MMKKKYITKEEYIVNIQPETKISFATGSPFQVVHAPSDKTVFVAYYGNLSFGSGPSLAIGTIEVCRNGAGTVVYDFDRYPIYTTGTTSIYEVVGPQKPPYHWTSNLPDHLRNQMPKWLIESSKEKDKNKP